MVCRVVTIGGAQVTQKSEYIVAGVAAEDTIFVLHANDISIDQIKAVGGAPVGTRIVLIEGEAHPFRVLVALGTIVDRQREDLAVWGRHVLTPHTDRSYRWQCHTGAAGGCRSPPEY
jgi:hypothetical protein